MTINRDWEVGDTVVYHHTGTLAIMPNGTRLEIIEIELRGCAYGCRTLEPYDWGTHHFPTGTWATLVIEEMAHEEANADGSGPGAMVAGRLLHKDFDPEW